GEIYVGGAGVARGYIQRADITADRFLPDPFAPQAGARLYRTGDRARYLPSGDLEYLGRVDSQLKVRGYRIEPAEIESRLEEHSWVARAVVTLREDRPGDKRLVAYITGRKSSPPTASELRGHLKSLVPDYMIPAVFVCLSQL